MATNSITLIGNLTRDPELRYTTGGRAVASFGLAATSSPSNARNLRYSSKKISSVVPVSPPAFIANWCPTAGAY